MKKQIEDFDSYSVDKQGNVHSTKGKGRILAPRQNRGGYFSVSLRRHKKSHSKKIHRLVALAFLPNPKNKSDVNHKNGIKTDNRVENLEWMTRAENMQHAVNSGLKICSEETKRKISKALKGHKHSEETKRKIGDGNRGKILTIETRQKISAGNKGKIITNETKRKMSKAQKGRRITEETRQKMSKAHKGKKFTAEHKRRLSESNKRRKNKNNGL